ncbi:MAG TPA: Clp protease N-terminal domain-containing protein, partial [Trueperaceae bacterium]|nr:Clp protease N-terminal domain-containing protein [Trueperaceae bacterium]
MDAERFTETALQSVASAQQIARTRQHQQVTATHLAVALLADADGPPARLVQRAGGDVGQAKAALDAALGRLPKVSGADGQYMAPEMARVFERAEKLAAEFKDQFVAADALLVAVREGGGDAVRALPDG